MSASKSRKPGNGLMGWLGRQVGYVRSALRADVEQKRLYRHEDIEEQQLPDHPGIKLRRTTVDEVIVERNRNGQNGMTK